MTKEKYLNDRKALLDAAQALIDEGKLEDAAKKSDDVKALDAQFEAEAKAAANLRALSDNAVGADLTARSVNLPGAGVEAIGASAEVEDVYNMVEYRRAFMNHVIKNEAIPAKFLNADANTKTTDIPAVIPTTIMEKIVERMESIGMILPLVTKTAYKGGVSIPTSTVKPVATWVAEGAGSPKQKKTVGNIQFVYHKLRCAISMSLETTVVALGIFETTFIQNVSDAMVKAQEEAIVVGTGSGQPKGFLTETPEDGQAITMEAADKPSYQTLVDAEAALPLAYENEALWFMTKKTFMNFIGMVDANKQPIARVNYGLNGRPERVLLGRSVVCNDYMVSYAENMAVDGIIAALFNPKDYVLNTNLDMTVKRYEDNDTDDEVLKAIQLVDGKTVDKGSLVTITKKKKVA